MQSLALWSLNSILCCLLNPILFCAVVWYTQVISELPLSLSSNQAALPLTRTRLDGLRVRRGLYLRDNGAARLKVCLSLMAHLSQVEPFEFLSVLFHLLAIPINVQWAVLKSSLHETWKQKGVVLCASSAANTFT